MSKLDISKFDISKLDISPFLACQILEVGFLDSLDVREEASSEEVDSETHILGRVG